MPRPKSKTVQTWECPKCDYFYHSPTRLHAVAHQCPSKMSLGHVRLKLKREER